MRLPLPKKKHLDKEKRMDELRKLERLLHHWMEHNEEHVKTYMEWAIKAESLGKKELSEVLREIAGKTEQMKGLFNRAKNHITPYLTLRGLKR